jgi:translation initiation factor IF-1
MNGIGTDVIALAAILGSGAVGGVATLALADGDSVDSDEARYECSVTMSESAAPVVVTLGGDTETIVVAPNVSVGVGSSCVAGAVIQEIGSERMEREMARARVRIERAQERMERAQERMERVQIRIRSGPRVRVRGLESALEGLDQELQKEIQGRLDEEMKRLDERLKRLDDGNGL